MVSEKFQIQILLCVAQILHRMHILSKESIPLCLYALLCQKNLKKTVKSPSFPKYLAMIINCLVEIQVCILFRER